jgi:hypothetical protein
MVDALCVYHAKTRMVVRFIRKDEVNIFASENSEAKIFVLNSGKLSLLESRDKNIKEHF